MQPAATATPAPASAAVPTLDPQAVLEQDLAASSASGSDTRPEADGNTSADSVPEAEDNVQPAGDGDAVGDADSAGDVPAE